MFTAPLRPFLGLLDEGNGSLLAVLSQVNGWNGSGMEGNGRFKRFVYFAAAGRFWEKCRFNWP